MSNLRIFLFIFAIGGIIFGCSYSNEGTENKTEFRMNQEKVHSGYDIYRYENKEVVCYLRSEAGLQCVWKKQ